MNPSQRADLESAAATLIETRARREFSENTVKAREEELESARSLLIDAQADFEAAAEVWAEMTDALLPVDPTISDGETT